MKKILIYITIILILNVLSLSGYILLNNNEKIIVSFNTNSDIRITNIEIKKGENINLPILEKDGYNFLGWYVGEEKINNNYKFNENTILNSKWKQDNLIYEMLVYCFNDECFSDDNYVEESLIEPFIVKTKTPSAKKLGYNKNFVLYDDDGIKIYDHKKRKTVVEKASLKSDMDFYCLYLNESKTKVIGIGYINGNYIGYYNVSSDKILYDKKFTIDEKMQDNKTSFLVNHLVQINNHNLSLKTDEMIYLLSSDEELIELSQENTSDDFISSSSYESYGANGKYIYSLYYCNTYEKCQNPYKVYGNNKKLLGELPSDSYLNIGEYISIIDHNAVKKYDYDGNLISTSKSYDESIALINRLRPQLDINNSLFFDNYILYVRDGNLILENVDDEKESMLITKWNYNFYVSIHSYYTKEEANNNSTSDVLYEEGIYIAIIDQDNDIITTTEYCYKKDKKLISYPPVTRLDIVVDKT